MFVCFFVFAVRYVVCLQWTGLVLQAFKRLQINMYLTQVKGVR